MVVYSKNVCCLSNLQIKIGLERVVENKSYLNLHKRYAASAKWYVNKGHDL